MVDQELSGTARLDIVTCAQCVRRASVKTPLSVACAAAIGSDMHAAFTSGTTDP